MFLLPCSFYLVPFTMSLLPCSFSYFYHVPFRTFTMFLLYSYHVPFAMFLLPYSFYHIPFTMFPFRSLSQHKGTTLTPTIFIPACSFFLSNPLLKDHASHSTIFPLPYSLSYFYHVPFCPRLTTKKEQPLLLACSLSERFLQKKEQPSCVYHNFLLPLQPILACSLLLHLYIHREQPIHNSYEDIS